MDDIATLLHCGKNSRNMLLQKVDAVYEKLPVTYYFEINIHLQIVEVAD